MNVVVLSKDAQLPNQITGAFRDKAMLPVEPTKANVVHFEEFADLSTYRTDNPIDYIFIEINFKSLHAFQDAGTTIATSIQLTNPSALIFMMFSKLKPTDENSLKELRLSNLIHKSAAAKTIIEAISVAKKRGLELAAERRLVEDQYTAFVTGVAQSTQNPSGLSNLLLNFPKHLPRMFSEKMELSAEAEQNREESVKLWELVAILNKELLHTDPTSAASAYMYGFACMKTGAPVQTVEKYLQLADSLAPGNLDRLKRTTEIFLQLSLSSRARESYKKVIGNMLSINFDKLENIQALTNHSDLKHVIEDPKLLETATAIARDHNNSGIASIRAALEEPDPTDASGRFDKAHKSYDYALCIIDKILGPTIADKLRFNKALSVLKNPNAKELSMISSIDILTALSTSPTFAKKSRCLDLIAVLRDRVQAGTDERVSPSSIPNVENSKVAQTTHTFKSVDFDLDADFEEESLTSK